MSRSKRSQACEFSQKVRRKIYARDKNSCIFCEIGYHTEKLTWFGKQLNGVMHFVPRSQGGLGIEQNGALGCNVHHEMLDNGNTGERAEMLQIFQGYLELCYPDWDKKKLYYRKNGGNNNG